jgi:hypothetical protein
MTPAANLPPVSTTPAVNFVTSSPCAVDTDGKFAHRCQRRRWQIAGFATGIKDTGGKLPDLPLVSKTPAANLPPVLLTPVANNENSIRLQTL